MILSIEIKLEQSQIVLDADVSFGNGEILFEIPSVGIQKKNHPSVTDFEESFGTSLKLFFPESVDYIHKGLFAIKENANSI